ncbi:unnamed protein product [Diabrotica balteata]|uniref:Uncharacterized protein n=1 Tax=Diabrotica balteata TaxID=107213 RepID=A0A9N9SSP4_DIABA|nr:unnamed protein product [Diabrotica balteata]
MKKIFNIHDIKLEIKVRLLKCYVFSDLFYGVESWTLTEASLKRLEAFEMWCYRRMLKIFWIDRVTNEEVLHRMGTERELVITIKRRKLKYLGHIMRNKQLDNLLWTILQG